MTPDEARRLLDGTTPGPWVRRRDADGNPTPVVVSAGPTDRHHIMTADPAASPERQQADTALIAAAPTLAAMRAGMHTEYAVEHQIVPGGQWYQVTGWSHEPPLNDGHTLAPDERIIRRYVTEPEEA